MMEELARAFKDRLIEIIQSQEQSEKRLKKKTEPQGPEDSWLSLRIAQDNTAHISNLIPRIIRKRECGIKKVYRNNGGKFPKFSEGQIYRIITSKPQTQ